MSHPFVDTSVIIRLLTGDDPDKQRRSRDLFERVEKRALTVAAPVTVIADAVYVLSSPRTYNRSRAEVAQLLTPLVRLPGFRVQNRRAVLAALALYGTTPGLDFGDAFVATTMQRAGSTTVYAYDTDFDRIAGVTRREP
jgi:predicted nucleic acid-binding protein